MTLKSIRLELARNPGFPEGSSAHGYDIMAPLTADGHLDRKAWERVKAQCTVRRFWAGGPELRGRLEHTAAHAWAFSYAKGEEDDEPIFRLEQHVFKPGEYVSITEHDGKRYTFKVIWVK